MTLCSLWLLAACAQPIPRPASWGDSYRLTGAQVIGHGQVEVEVRGGLITAIGEADPTLSAIPLPGWTVEPGWIDSHVHLRYLPQPAEMAAGGVAVAIDLAAPQSFLTDRPQQLKVLASGPMITALGGYPTQSWGAGGYGLEVRDQASAVAATEGLIQAGAFVIKLPVTSAPVLDEATLRAVVDTAHRHGVKVVSHAITDADAALAGQVGCDVLAHTPTEALSEATVHLWADRAVISTLAAFGGSPTTLQNLRRMREAGTRVLYGTDFGNTRTPGVDPRELELMKQTGMSQAQILASGTTTPAQYWGLEGYGQISVGGPARFRLLPPNAARPSAP